MEYMNESLHIPDQNGFPLYKIFFFVLVPAYILLYAPFGINETDGGFLSAYAWRMFNGEVFYRDFIYVRPPMSLFLRAIEMGVMPEGLEIIGERILFYLKLAIYSYLGASVLLEGQKKWILASLGFILSVHAYPAAGWHTVDGLLFGVLAAYIYFKRPTAVALLAMFVVASMLCKQSFYPILPLFIVLLLLQKPLVELVKFLAAGSMLFAFFYWFMYSHSLVIDFLNLTVGAASASGAFQHGFVDYLNIDWKALVCLILLIPILLNKTILIPKKYWLYLFVFVLASSYAAAILTYQSFTNPISHMRLVFILSLAYLIFNIFRQLKNSKEGILNFLKSDRVEIRALVLLAILWMSSISWGYNFPILFSTPIIFVFMMWADELEPRLSKNKQTIVYAITFIGALFLFRLAHHFVYRDGPRNEMTYKMEEVFPQLKFIYSNKKTYDLYSELKDLHTRYGDTFKTLPAFPLSNYLTKTQSPLALDWVFNLETNGQNQRIYEQLAQYEGYIFVQKEYKTKISQLKKYEVTRFVMENFEFIEESDNFMIYRK